MRANDIVNGYFVSLLLSTTTAVVVSDEGIAQEIPVKKSVRISL